MKSEVYSWRLSPKLKSDLEDAARQEDLSVSELLERIVAAWIAGCRATNINDEREQRRLHRAASRTFGTIRGGDPGRSERVRETVRTRLANLRARQRPD